MIEQPKTRSGLFTISGTQYIARDCEEVEVLREKINFIYCPVCGVTRSWAEGKEVLKHDPSYTGVVH